MTAVTVGALGEAGAAAVAMAPEEEVRLCCFRVGSDEMVLDIMRVREILRAVPLTPVPRASHGVVGMLDLRGEVVPVLDLRVRFGLPPAEDLSQRRLMVVLDHRRCWGLYVDAVSEVVRVPRSAIRPGQEVMSGEAAEIFAGVCHHRGRLLLMLNIHRLLLGVRTLSELTGATHLPRSGT
jgi:purine-binding chemotaxis protein CheW